MPIDRQILYAPRPGVPESMQQVYQELLRLKGVTIEQSGELTLQITTGLTTTPDVVIDWVRQGSIVLMHIRDAVSGTSNATTMVLGTLPDFLIPRRARRAIGSGQDNGTNVIAVYDFQTDGTIDVYDGIGAGTWTASGTKGVNDEGHLIYML